MNIKYHSAVIFVKNIKASRNFYENLLEQELEFDFGLNVLYVGGLSLWQVDHAHQIVFGQPWGEVGQGELELCFESDDMEAVVQRLTDAGVEFVHPLCEQPWGQRVVRVYDPDGHIVEVGEPISVFVARFLAQGMSVEEASERTSVPLEVVQQIAQSINREDDMSQASGDLLAYYASPGPMTDPREYACLFDGLPTEIPALVEVVQGLLIHIFWAERYGLQLSKERGEHEVNLRSVAQKLKRIQELDAAPLTLARPLEKKLVGNCRDFSTLLCAMLRHQGVPARARCGFGTYFMDDRYPYVDHWVCEYWKADEGRWVMVDAQLDVFQREVLEIAFDPLDMPPGQFVTGGRGWQMCRAGEADPHQFGIFEWYGLWFVRGDLMRDFLALNKVEILPWDGGWGYLEHAEDLEAEMPESMVALMDRIAALTLAGDEAFGEIRATYEGDSRFHIPSEMIS